MPAEHRDHLPRSRPARRCVTTSWRHAHGGTPANRARAAGADSPLKNSSLARTHHIYRKPGAIIAAAPLTRHDCANSARYRRPEFTQSRSELGHFGQSGRGAESGPQPGQPSSAHCRCWANGCSVNSPNSSGIRRTSSASGMVVLRKSDHVPDLFRPTKNTVRPREPGPSRLRLVSREPGLCSCFRHRRRGLPG
jgi:hypothetical protein